MVGVTISGNEELLKLLEGSTKLEVDSWFTWGFVGDEDEAN